MQVIGPVWKAEHALQALAQDGPDGAIIDLNLHQRLPFDVVQALRDRVVPFIVYTGYSKLAFRSVSLRRSSSRNRWVRKTPY
jgi:ActR/RegA family two-component response regulator